MFRVTILKSQGVSVCDRPPMLPIIINNIDSSVDIENGVKQLIEFRNRYGIVDTERIYKHDKSPNFSIKANVLTLLNLLRLIRDGIHLDFTGMRMLNQQNYARAKCGNPSHIQRECKNLEKCLRCGDYKRMITACKNEAKCLNCKGNHQCNNNTYALLVNKTI
ncbi:unnamed protein product [Brachionus calyciflorus]|uniref:Uncharacterized protein n=1 Tax=Brachionus calyciflorus TaxID=104777 RepID=A0A814QBW4_9BILA|nr:unnamed protein product [Brachionus calyciflorus]